MRRAAPSLNAGFRIACYNAGAQTAQSFSSKTDWLYRKLRGDISKLLASGASIIAMQETRGLLVIFREILLARELPSRVIACFTLSEIILCKCSFLRMKNSKNS